MPMRTAALLCALALSACQGPEGPAGLTGPEGPPGTDGAPGQPATFTERTFPVNAQTCVNYFYVTECAFAWGALAGGLGSGVVLAYFRGDGGTGAWVSVPFTVLLDNDGDGLSDGALATSFVVGPGEFALAFTPLEGAPAGSYLGGEVRAVVLSQASAAARAAPTYDALLDVVAR